MLEFQPLLKRIRWGGRRLGTVLGKPIGPETDYAESWEVVDHGEDQSVVASGPHQGATLADLVRDEGDYLFGRHTPRRQFPLLVKFLDAKDRLSLQVHPNDAQAKTYDPKENGKTEAWVILDAAPDSLIFAGLKDGVGPDDLRAALAAERVEDCVHSFHPRNGDCVFIPAGTVHAIGEGVLLAEIQQSSDLTFRLHDWGRVGTDGKPRPIHIEESMACIDFNCGPIDPATPTLVESEPHKIEELARSDYFVMRRHTADAEFKIGGDNRFHILTPLSGTADVDSDSAVRRSIKLGDTLLSPAAEEATISPNGGFVLLETFLP